MQLSVRAHACVRAQVVADMMVRMRRELGTDDNPIPPEIDQIILLDRAVDLITPMCSQLTYEGLIDEVYSIQNSMRVAAAAIGYAAHPNPDVGVLVSSALQRSSTSSRRSQGSRRSARWR